MARDRKEKIQGRDVVEIARRRSVAWVLLVALLVILAWVVFHPFRPQDALLVVSYDVTREYFSAIRDGYQANQAPEEQTRILFSHAGSVRQASNVARGLEADVISLASASDLDLATGNRFGADPDWPERFPNSSSPYTSTIVFLVRKGNPRGIRDWNDLFDQDVRVVSPDPAVSGAGRYAYLAATVQAGRRHSTAGDVEPSSPAWEDLVSLYRRVDFIEFGARQALEVFRRRARGDVFLTWESEALRLKWAGDPDLEMVIPSSSIQARPVVAVVGRHVDARGTRDRAVALINFLFSPEGQAIAARHGFRPRDPGVDVSGFPQLELFNVEDVFGERQAAWEKHFGDGGIYRVLLRDRLARRGGVE